MQSNKRVWHTSRAKGMQARAIMEVLRRGWLDAYPNADDPDPRHRITKEDILAYYEERASPEAMLKFARGLEAPSGDKVWIVATEGSKIVGVAYGGISKTYNEVKILYVVPSYQRRNVGFTLLLSFFHHDEDPELPVFDHRLPTRVEVATYNTKAIKFYRKFGFVETGRHWEDEELKFKSGVNFPLMEMVLPPRPVSS